MVDKVQRGDGAHEESLSVSAALALAKGALEAVVIRLVGEVSEVSAKAGYKAVYFTVKDEKASLPCMMWVNRYRAAGIELSVGSLVELTGRFSLYAAKGRMNFEVFSLSLAGEGQLRLQVANLARELQAMGLMDSERKRPLPLYPQTIGLVTSPRGAAVHDVLRTLRRRYPMARVLLAGVPVEGAQASAALVDGLAEVVYAGAEVVLLVRGGGSFEDLMPFNDRRLARTIAACPVPVVTGIGHEPDTTIADMVADVRASTPTGAAEAVAPSSEQIETHLRSLALALSASQHDFLERYRLRVWDISLMPLFSEPERLFESEALALDDLSARLTRVLPESLHETKHELEIIETTLARLLPSSLHSFSQSTSEMQQCFKHLGKHLLDRYNTANGKNASRLHDLSPLAVLGRGYAFARDDNGALVDSVSKVTADDKIVVRVCDGDIHCVVRDTVASFDGA